MTYSKLRALLLKRFHLPKERTLARAVRSFSPAEKTIFYILSAVFVLSAVILVYQVSRAYMVSVPARGGTLTEGVIGNPRFLNPVLAFSEADKSLDSLIYSGLLKEGSDGRLKNDLAQSVTVSPDGLTYTVKLRPEAAFQDGAKVTADDVIFTIDKILDPSIKSPLYGDWSGVQIQKVDDETVSFVLKKAYAPFLTNLTVGILPKHIWNNVSDEEFAFSQFNTLPVGSGPYKIDSVTRNSGGIPDHYELVPFEGALGGVPYIGRFAFNFYPSEADAVTAFANGDIDAMASVSPEDARVIAGNADLLTSPLPRIFGVFFNQSQNQALQDQAVRQALDLAAPRSEIVEDVLDGFATPIDSPLPPSLFPWAKISSDGADDRLQEAQTILAKDGWQPDPQTGVLEKKSKKGTMTLSFSISTGNAPELKAVAAKLEAAWAKLGVDVKVELYETGDLNQNIIRPRHYDALLFGEVVGQDADVYPFWHSSQRNDPGLNIALYANSKADKLLEDARKASDPAQREKDYKAFNQEVASDVPAVFLYAPNFIYAVPKDLHSAALGQINSPEDRFADIRSWYLETDDVWQLFVK